MTGYLATAVQVPDVVDGPSGWFWQSSGNTLVCPENNCVVIIDIPQDDDPIEGFVGLTPTDLYVATDTTATGTEILAPASEWLTRSYLYTKLDANQTLIDNTAQTATFWESESETAMLPIHETDKERQALLQTDASTLGNMITDAHLLSNRLHLLSGMSNNLPSNPTMAQLQAAAATKRTYAATHIESLSQTQVTAATNAIIAHSEGIAIIQNINNDMVVAAQHEENEQLTNSIMLDKIAAGNDNYDEEEWLMLDMISHQCPAIGGRAVYRARAMKSSKVLEMYSDSAVCAAAVLPLIGRVNNNANEQTETAEAYLTAWPNPSRGDVFVSFGAQKDCATMQITNQFGQILMQRPLTLTSGTIQLDMATYSSGVYSCQLLDTKGAVIATSNILVSK